jgi:hypothetical protein
MRNLATLGKTLAVTLAAVVTVAGLTACAGGVCREGSAAPSLTLLPYYAQTHRQVTSIRLCVRGGGCATAAVLTYGTSPAAPAVSPGATQPARSVRAMDFSRLVPAGPAGQGPDGGPVDLTVTAYSESGPVTTATAALSPIRQLPANRCELNGYVISAEFYPDGHLSYYPIA